MFKKKNNKTNCRCKYEWHAHENKFMEKQSGRIFKFITMVIAGEGNYILDDGIMKMAFHS